MARFPLTRTSSSAIAAGVAVLVVLTVLGTAPQPESDDEVGAGSAGLTPMVSESAPATSDADALTFDQLFDQMRQPEASGEGQGTTVVAAPVETPEPAGSATPATPSGGSATVEVPAVLPNVEPVRPALAVTGLGPDADQVVGAVDGVRLAAAATVGEVELAVPGGPTTVTVAAVDPERFRPLTPGVTANETAVWQRIIAGDAAFNHDAGNRLTAPLGTTVDAGTTGEPLRIGAYASNGIPPVADALVSAEKAEGLGLSGETTWYVAIDDGANIDAVVGALAAAGAQVAELEAPVEQQAFLTGSAAADFFEPFNYIDHGDGLITIDPDWVARNIDSRRLPVFQGDVTCHRQMLIQLEGALAEVEARGLSHLIDVNDYGGCWVARHIDWNPSKPISMHGWGLAVDFNVQTNGLGRTPTMDPRIVEVFDRWGFVWGGRWSRPDGMHFEIGAVLQDPPTDLVSDLGQ